MQCVCVLSGEGLLARIHVCALFYLWHPPPCLSFLPLARLPLSNIFQWLMRFFLHSCVSCRVCSFILARIHRQMDALDKVTLLHLVVNTLFTSFFRIKLQISFEMYCRRLLSSLHVVHIFFSWCFQSRIHIFTISLVIWFVNIHWLYYLSLSMNIANVCRRLVSTFWIIFFIFWIFVLLSILKQYSICHTVAMHWCPFEKSNFFVLIQ